MSLPEVMLWQHLRTRSHGLKFRRQHPFGSYVLDFYCPGVKLAIEIDGEAHNCGGRPERDVIRDAAIMASGVRVLRIPAADVLADVIAVADAIVRAALPLHRPAGGPPPHALHGEDHNVGAC